MEAAGGFESLEDKIKPPRLEDAGLEDCALPPESIREAFLKAASAVGSMVTDSDDEGQCVEESTDVLVGIADGVSASSKGCIVEKGVGSAEDKVVVGGDAEAIAKADAVVGPSLPQEGEACIDGLQGLEIGGKDRGSVAKKLGG